MSSRDRGKKSPPGHLSPEDKLLWSHAMREAKTLSKRRKAVPTTAPAEDPAAPPPKKKSAAPRTIRPAPAPPAAKRKAPPPLAAGATVDVDRRTAERLKRGQLPIEATLDLHGHRQATAHGELNRFLADAHGAGRRCVLIITGKGASKSGGGVLRAEVPRWLNEPDNRARIVAFAGARPQHGGGGALYVLLRRRRMDRP